METQTVCLQPVKALLLVHAQPFDGHRSSQLMCFQGPWGIRHELFSSL